MSGNSVSRSVASNFAIPWTVACQAPLSMKFSQLKKKKEILPVRILEWVAMSFSRGPREALMSGKIIPTIWGREWRFPGIRPSLTLWSLMVGLGTVLVPLGMPFNSLGGSDGKESA